MDLVFIYVNMTVDKIGKRADLPVGTFNNHVDKSGWVGGSKIAIFVHT